MGHANRFLVTFGLALLPFSVWADCAPKADAGASTGAATAASAAPVSGCVAAPAATVAPAATDQAPEAQTIATSAPSADPAAGYQKKTEFDNTPYRFNAEKGFTAAEFDAWMASRGIRIATGKPTSTAAAGALPASQPPGDASVPTAVPVDALTVAATPPVGPTPAPSAAPAPAPAPVFQSAPVATSSTGCSAAGRAAAC